MERQYNYTIMSGPVLFIFFQCECESEMVRRARTSREDNLMYWYKYKQPHFKLSCRGIAC